MPYWIAAASEAALCWSFKREDIGMSSKITKIGNCACQLKGRCAFVLKKGTLQNLYLQRTL